jgi:hypothetical protein
MEDQLPHQEHVIVQHTELTRDVFSEVVKAAAEAATMSVFAALGSGTMTMPHNAPAPPPPAGTNEDRSSDGNQPETEASQPFQRTCPLRCVCIDHLVRYFQDRRERLRFRVLTKSNLWMYVLTCVLYSLLTLRRRLCEISSTRRAYAPKKITILDLPMNSKLGHTKNLAL